jgi:hypothetical protein
VRCLLIVPFPESALNDEAGKLFMEDYEEYHKQAKLITQIYATPKEIVIERSSSAIEVKICENILRFFRKKRSRVINRMR